MEKKYNRYVTIPAHEIDGKQIEPYVRILDKLTQTEIKILHQNGMLETQLRK